MCGVMITLSIRHKGWSSGRGSISKTSRPAPESLPFSRAMVRALRSTTLPRPMLMRMASCFMAAMAAPSIMWAVSSVCGTQMATKSDWASIWWRSWGA